MSLRSSLTFSMHHLSLRGGGDVPFFRARMFSTANCSALIFLAVPLAELFFVFFVFFFHQHNRKGKSIFFFFWQSRVFNCPPPSKFKCSTPLWKKKIHDLCLFTYVDKDLLLLPQSAFSRKILWNLVNETAQGSRKVSLQLISYMVQKRQAGTRRTKSSHQVHLSPPIAFLSCQSHGIFVPSDWPTAKDQYGSDIINLVFT